MSTRWQAAAAVLASKPGTKPPLIKDRLDFIWVGKLCRRNCVSVSSLRRAGVEWGGGAEEDDRIRVKSGACSGGRGNVTGADCRLKEGGREDDEGVGCGVTRQWIEEGRAKVGGSVPSAEEEVVGVGRGIM